MDEPDGMNVRYESDGTNGMDGIHGVGGRGTTFTPSNNHRVIKVCTHRITSVPLGRHQC